MADIFTKEKRSEVMSRVRSAGNKTTEQRMLEVFCERQITGWRRKSVKLKQAGEKISIRPDFVFPTLKIAVFVDGEFWHGHATRATIPKTRRDWWLAKIDGNKKRDRMQNRLLRMNGWKVVRIWQYQLTKTHLSLALRKLRSVGLLSL